MPKSQPKARRSRPRVFSPAHTATHPTLQHPAADANINNIVGRWLTTGNPPTHVNLHTPKWGDFSNASDFHNQANRVAQMTQSFAALPGEIRKQFENSPEQLMDFVLNPDNRAEAISLGLLPEDTSGATNVAPTPPADPQDTLPLRDTSLEEDPNPAPTDSVEAKA